MRAFNESCCNALAALKLGHSAVTGSAPHSPAVLTAVPRPSSTGRDAHPARLVAERQNQLAAELGTAETLAALREGRLPGVLSASQAQSPAASPHAQQTSSPFQHSPAPPVEGPVPSCSVRKGHAGQSCGGLEIHPELNPSITPESLSRIDSTGAYHSTPDEQAMHKHFMERQHVLPMLSQDSLVTSLFLFDTADQNCYRPGSVLVDTGADLFICVSKHWAAKCGLTVQPGSSGLIGVGGAGGAKGLADQKIRVMLGSNGEPGDYSVSPLQGAFTMWVQPYVMTEQMQRDIDFEVIIGGAFLRACLGSVDYMRETLEISPAWLKHQLPDLRVSIPLVTSSVPRCKVALIRSLRSAPQAASLHDLLSAGKSVHASRPPAVSQAGGSRPASSSPAGRRQDRRHRARSDSPQGRAQCPGPG